MWLGSSRVLRKIFLMLISLIITMPAIAVLGDAHLLMQAEWFEDESKIAEEGEEIIENFWRALEQLRKESPDAVIFAGDMFDYRTKSGQRVSHREGEKYMLKIRDIIFKSRVQNICS